MVAPLVYYSKRQVSQGTIVVPVAGVVNQIWYDCTRSGYKQKPPFTLDSSYSVTLMRCNKGWSWQFPGNGDTTVDLTAAVNKARAKFTGELGQSSQLGSTLTAEMRSTFELVVGGATKALFAARHVKRGRLDLAAEILGFNPPEEKKKSVKSRKLRSGRVRYYRTYKTVWVMPNGRRVVKSLANKWLWYSYGVRPLVDDMYNAMDVLTREQPSGDRILGSGSAASQRTNGNGWTYSSKSSVQISANVRVANPNLWLANQLGLINPVQWINEAIPFSFVIDWFSNLSQIIDQMTDFVGLEVTKPVTTSKSSCVLSLTIPSYGNLQCVTERINFTRDLSIPAAKFRVAYERPNWQRGANAISLLVGFLKQSQ